MHLADLTSYVKAQEQAERTLPAARRLGAQGDPERGPLRQVLQRPHDRGVRGRRLGRKAVPGRLADRGDRNPMELPNFSVEHLKKLPLWAMVAFAARTCRRVEHLAQLPEGQPGKEERRIADGTESGRRSIWRQFAQSRPRPGVGRPHERLRKSCPLPSSYPVRETFLA